MNIYRGAIFDLDGTLLDTVADIAASANLVLAEYGHPGHDISAYKTFVGRGFMDLLHRAFPAGTPEEEFPRILDRMLFHYGEHYMDRTAPYEGIPQLLSKLQNAGILLAVNSNKRDLYTKKLITAHFPLIRFVEVLGEGGDFPRKPKPDGALHIAGLMNLKPEQILYIGDSGTDMDTGHNAGMDTLGCLWGFRGEKELREHSAAYLAASADDIAQQFLA
ncbi:MAG: HAD family hydrolase [Lachnospiraceae bacterium]|nr:HAD family hydrolase [Lachnospiraceae bacterium]